MVAEIRIYVEGHHRLDSGFKAFLGEIRQAARQRAVRCEPIMCGATPVRDFMKALRTHPDALNVLLIDSDRSFDNNLFEQLRQRDDWQPPPGAEPGDDRVFWMVQLMESWFLADRDALRIYYGQGFHTNALPGNPQVENVPKADVLAALKAATRGTTKGEYHKTAHAPQLLARLDPVRVKTAAPNCRRLFETLLEKLAA